MIILYPNNKAYHSFRSQECVGTNETFGIPAERKAPFGKSCDDTEIYHFNGEQIKAFFTDTDQEDRTPKKLYRYQVELQHTLDRRIYRIRNSKRSNAMKSLLERVEKKQAIGG